jgi:K+-transporting ATPase ATPase C chain
MGGLILEVRRSLVATVLLAVILCGIYPLAVWILAQLCFPDKANGSMVLRNGEIVGSRLIGQKFNDPKYFRSRPSAAGAGYDASSSGGSNLGPLSGKLVDVVGERIGTYRSENDLSPDAAAPADAVTASGSGLDPHISLMNALAQAPRVALARGASTEKVRSIISIHTEGRDLAFLGEPRVNVLMLNLAMDRGL